MFLFATFALKTNNMQYTLRENKNELQTGTDIEDAYLNLIRCIQYLGGSSDITLTGVVVRCGSH